MPRNIRIAALALAAGSLGAALACAAEAGFLQSLFGGSAPDRSSACFARVYDARHLAAHKGQRLRDVAVKLTIRDENGARRLDHSLATHLVGSRQKYWSGGQCDRFDGLVAHCYVEGDGGAVDLTLAPDGRSLTARFADFRIWRPQDAADESEMTIDRSPADKVARLERAPAAACRGTGD